MVQARKLTLIRQILRSRTMLVAILIEVLGVIQLHADFLSTLMSPAQFGWVMLGIGLAMKILRMVTTGSVGDK